MNQSKIIEFSKSTLISLKAELLRKQDEVNKAKLEPKNQISNFKPSSRFENDAEVTEVKVRKPLVDAEEAEALRRSKESLERKSRLYDNLSEGTITSDKEEHYLVNFKKKASEDGGSVKNDSKTLSDTFDVKSDDDDDDTKNDDDLSDDDWVDYEDCLGRVRRCLKTDLEHIKQQDNDLKESLHPSKKPVTEDKQWVKEGTSVIEEPTDAYKEMLKNQWEKKEQELLNKDTVHYEDVLFNEARAHGVGYYALSGDEALRAKQQADLKSLHEETERERKAASEARSKREHALQLRVRAARARQRARAGLPPEEDEPESVPSVTSMLLDFVEEQKKVSSDTARKEREAKEVEAQKEREKFVREWDLGKEDLEKQRHKIMSQEEWVDKKRKERPQEFAPVQSDSRYNNKNATSFDDRGFYFDTQGDTSSRKTTWEDVRPTKSTGDTSATCTAGDQSSQSLYFTTKKRKEDIKNKYFDPSVNAGEAFEPVPIRNEAAEEDECVKSDKKCTNERKGAEVAPPPTYEYYGPVDRKRRKEDNKKINVEESFEVGLHLLEEKALKKGQRKGRDFTDDF